MRGAGDFQLRQKFEAAQRRIAALEIMVVEYEDIFSHYMFIDKKPDYYYSFSGNLIFQEWARNCGLTAAQAEVLVIISYIEMFLTVHHKLYSRNKTRTPVKYVLEDLVRQKYVIKIKVMGKSSSKLRNGWVLTQKGKDLEADYERFYDAQMNSLQKGELYTFHLEKGVYFRKVRLSPFSRRILQGGGKLKPTGRTGVRSFVEPEVLTKRYGE